MKATGIVRRIDDLGRVVIPKEIRRTMRIRESEPLEIFTGREGEIILKKYSPINEMTDFARQYADSISQVTGRTVLVADRDKFIAASSKGKNYIGKDITKEMEARLENREAYVATRDDRIFIKLTDDMPGEVIHQAVAPIISRGDMIGAVVLLEEDHKKRMSDSDLKMIQTAAGFLGKQMEE